MSVWSMEVNILLQHSGLGRNQMQLAYMTGIEGWGIAI